MDQLDTLRMAVTSTMHKVSRHWRRLVQDITAAHGVSEACAPALIAIGRLGDGVRQGLVAEEIGIEGPSLVRLLDQICAAGLVERRDDAVDRRAKTLWLTPEGRRVTRRIEEDVVALRARVLDGIDSVDLEAALRVFRAFEAAVGRGAEFAAVKEEAVP